MKTVTAIIFYPKEIFLSILSHIESIMIYRKKYLIFISCFSQKTNQTNRL